jgi:hypothetical protein
LEECFVCNEDARGSNPLTSIPSLRLAPIPTEHPETVDGLLNEICEIFDYEPDEIELIFSAAIRPKE